MSADTLHAKIMNLRPSPITLPPYPALAYDNGHRDARHAVAEIASAHAAAQCAALVEALEAIKNNAGNAEAVWKTSSAALAAHKEKA